MSKGDNMEKDSDKIKELGTYSVSSASRANKTTPKTVSFTIPAVPKPQLGRPSVNRRTTFLAALFIAATLLSGFAGGYIESRRSDNALFGTSLSNQKKIVTSQSQLISQIAKTVGPSVVSVNVSITSASAQSGFGLNGFSQPEQEHAAGTGIIISSDVVMTNRHVVPAGTTKVSVTLSDGTELKDVTVIGRTNNSDNLDVAFLKITDLKGHKLKPAAIGDSGTVQVGDDAIAIGNALGQFQNTVTAGIISGHGRSVQAGDGSGSSGSSENLDDLFQTDAAINEGNSGGPLVNLNGQVIGINTAIAGNAQNIGFSIPINDVRGLITQVLKTGKLQRPYLGVRYIPLTADVSTEFSLSVNNGAFIAPSSDPAAPSVVSGGPADQAGLQEKDIITQIDGKNIDQTHSLTSLLANHQPGDKVKVTILRGNDTKHIDVTLGRLPTDASQ